MRLFFGALTIIIPAAFRELLELKGDKYFWKVDYKEVFRLAADELYKTLLNKVKTAKGVTTPGFSQLQRDMPKSELRTQLVPPAPAPAKYYRLDEVVRAEGISQSAMRPAGERKC